MEEYTVSRARYAKGMMIVRCPSAGGWKTRAARLAEYLRGRYTGREDGYVMSPRKAQRLAELHAGSWDAKYLTPELLPPPAENP